MAISNMSNITILSKITIGEAAVFSMRLSPCQEPLNVLPATYEEAPLVLPTGSSTLAPGIVLLVEL